QAVLVELALVVQDVRENVGHLDQLPFVKPRDDLLDRLARVLVFDDLAGRFRWWVVEIAALHTGAVLADERAIDADVPRGDRLERLRQGVSRRRDIRAGQ